MRHPFNQQRRLFHALTIILLVLCVFVLLAARARAQDNHAGAVGTISPSTGAGYETGVGGALVGSYAALYDRLILTGQIGLEYSPKSYIGDGRVTRARLESRFYWAGQAKPSQQLKFFLSPGLNYSRTDTSQYSKQAINPMAGGGVAFANNDGRTEQLFIGRYHYLFKERQTENRVRGHRVGLDVYWPVKLNSHWFYLGSLEFQRWHYLQPSGPNQGNRTASSVGIQAGLGWRQ